MEINRARGNIGKLAFKRSLANKGGHKESWEYKEVIIGFKYVN
jgi:hypothetical protein